LGIRIPGKSGTSRFHPTCPFKFTSAMAATLTDDGRRFHAQIGYGDG
jgi:hypothetical protein